MTTKEKILAQIKKNPNSTWEEMKSSLVYTEFANMTNVIRGLEQEGFLHRKGGKDGDGKHTLHIVAGKRPIAVKPPTTATGGTN